MGRLQSWLGLKTLVDEFEGIMEWTMTKDNAFSVKSIYRILKLS